MKPAMPGMRVAEWLLFVLAGSIAIDSWYAQASPSPAPPSPVSRLASRSPASRPPLATRGRYQWAHKRQSRLRSERGAGAGGIRLIHYIIIVRQTLLVVSAVVRSVTVSWLADDAVSYEHKRNCYQVVIYPPSPLRQLSSALSSANPNPTLTPTPTWP